MGWDSATKTVLITSANGVSYDVILEFPANEYPQTAAHMTTAMANGESNICTIDRDGADDNRDESLAGIPTKDGFDRDEWPMAMCAEGGAGASVAYVEPSDNRGAGSWVGHQLSDYEDGTRVLFKISGEASAGVDTTIPTEPEPAGEYEGEYDPFGEDRNCGDFNAHVDAQAFFEAAGGPDEDPHRLDADSDGVVCESLG